MTPFEQLTSRVERILHDNASLLPLIGPMLVSRDPRGRIALFVEYATRDNEASNNAVHALSAALCKRLGPRARKGTSAVLYDEKISDAYYGAPAFPLGSFEGVQVIDRSSLGCRWNAALPVSAGRPRVLFHSVKGGVGRSTALAAAGCVLARSGMRVLIVDLDLESPGITTGLLPMSRRPAFGVIDWMLDDLVGKGSALIGKMLATSPLAPDSNLTVVPAHGRQAGEYVSKLGRRTMANGATSEDKWPLRLHRLLSTLEEKVRPDITLIDAALGLGDLPTGCIAQLGPQRVLLFATEAEQHWTTYHAMFDCWRRYGVAPTLRERVQYVRSWMGHDTRGDSCNEMRDHAYRTLFHTLYGPDWAFQRKDALAPHSPWKIARAEEMVTSRDLHTLLSACDNERLHAIFGELIEGIAKLVVHRNAAQEA